MRAYFLTTARIGFGTWSCEDRELAGALWGDAMVTRFVYRDVPDDAGIWNRLQTELSNQERYGVQYWPLFDLATNEFLGCCGLRPAQGERVFELGFHLRPAFWGKGFATEAARAVIAHAFGTLGARELIAGHHPDNQASRRALERLGFVGTGEQYYPPTGRFHPGYRLQKQE